MNAAKGKSNKPTAGWELTMTRLIEKLVEMVLDNPGQHANGIKAYALEEGTALRKEGPRHGTWRHSGHRNFQPG